MWSEVYCWHLIIVSRRTNELNLLLWISANPIFRMHIIINIGLIWASKSWINRTVFRFPDDHMVFIRSKFFPFRFAPVFFTCEVIWQFSCNSPDVCSYLLFRFIFFIIKSFLPCSCLGKKPWESFAPYLAQACTEAHVTAELLVEGNFKFPQGKLQPKVTAGQQTSNWTFPWRNFKLPLGQTPTGSCPVRIWIPHLFLSCANWTFPWGNFKFPRGKLPQ